MTAPVSGRERRRVAAMLAGMCLAMAMMRGVADAKIMARAVMRANEELAQASPLRCQIRAIARDWQFLSRNEDDIRARGRDLLRAVQRETWPSASPRADIEG